MVSIEQPQLLTAVHPVERIVDIENDTLRHRPERATVLLDECSPQAQQRPQVGEIFQPRDGRLRAQPLARGQAIERQLEHRIGAQCVGVVAVLVAGGDHQHAKPDDLRQAMHDLLRRSRVLQTAGQAVGQTQPAFNLAQRQQAPFRGQPATVKTGDHGLALHWWQTGEKRRNINHGGCSSG